ncbi:MAG: uroporphyrinogen decarboxylase [Candidatus Aquicultorales bacterium]
MKLSRSDRFLKACRREPVDRTPIWMMRQAGRYLPEYMEIRQKHDFLTMCKTPELAAEVTIQPVRLVGVDAAILFADILLPLEGMGLGLEFAKGEGPVIHNAVRSVSDVDRVTVADPIETTGYVMDAIRLIRKELNGDVPLIGFSGAPFTLASYMIEGGGSKEYINCKKLMFSDSEAWHKLMEKIAETVILYLNAQIEAGAQAVQVFDSWVGTLSPDDYEEYVFPHQQKVIEGVSGKVPVINFANNASTLLELVSATGGDVIGVDWRINLDTAWERIGFDKGIQGNFDPIALFATPEAITRKAKAILDKAAGRPGHIFNLGHGINKATPVEHAKHLVRTVHELSAR